MSESVWIALIAAIPPTLMALTGLVYAMKSKSSLEKKIDERHDITQAKVDNIKTEVDGKLSQMIQTVKEIALATASSKVRSDHGRKSDQI